MRHPYSFEDIESLSHMAEGYRYERKSARKDVDEIAKHIMAFANSEGGMLVDGCCRSSGA